MAPLTIRNTQATPPLAASSVSSSSNPLLEYQPAYTYSMPTQLLILGIVLTLLSVLLLHLLFTAKYHYPLARCNFLLLLSAVILTQISTITLVIVTNTYLFNRSRYWPFMFDYIEVTIPMPDWNPVSLAGWYIMQGAVTFLAHATHIQFLTLLFPSSLERKLILSFLGPLCVFASVLFFTHFLSNPNYQDLGDAIRNTATSTLSLLYTFGLLIWGYVVNRKRAWEYEGGTFGFGVMSISLALVGTAANFIEVREDRLKWLPWLVNTVLLWQSWAGFWWWVGAGMWSGEVKDIEQREIKRKRREERRQRKRSKMLNVISNLSRSSRDLACNVAPSAQDPNNPTEGPLKPDSSHGSAIRPSGPSTVFRRISTWNNKTVSPPDGDHNSHIELQVLSPPLNASGDQASDWQVHSPATEVSSSTNDTSTLGFFSFFRQPVFLQRWLGTLSEAHNEAAKQQARTAGGIKQTEQVKRFGLRAMTQRVVMEKIRQQNNLSQSNLPGLSRKPSKINRRSPLQEAHLYSRQNEIDRDVWISEDESASGLSIPSINQQQDRSTHAQQHAGSSRQSDGHQLECLRFTDQQTYANAPGPSQWTNQDPRDEGSSQGKARTTEGSSTSRHPHTSRLAHKDDTDSNQPASSSSAQPTPEQQRSRTRNLEFNWRQPILKARLRDVTTYD